MRSGNIVRGVGALALAAGSAAYFTFRREMQQARSALESASLIIDTVAGPIEFGREGAGLAALIIHGAGGGYDQGLMIGRDTLGSGFDLIAPSRFGYLRTPLGPDLSPSAQADAHAALLDALGIDKVVVLAASAGAPSAIELALRFPDRVSALILLVPRAYAPGQIVGPDRSRSSQAVLKLIESSADFALWLGMRFARPAIVRFLGVPPELEARAAPKERKKITTLMRSILPLSRRIAGIEAEDAFEMVEWPLHKVHCPALIVSAEDDLFGTLPGARFTAEHMADAELKVFETGGHLLVGHDEEVKKVVVDFLDRQRPVRKAA